MEKQNDSLSTVQYTVTHYEQVCSRSYEEVVAAFEKSVGDADDGKFLYGMLALNNVKDYEALCNRLFGPSGFMHILTFDHGHWLSFYGKDTKMVQYTYGNPLLAYTMLQHEIAMGLYVPFRVLIYQHPNGEVRISFDLPSSQMTWLGNSELDEKARQIDKKVLAFIADLAGVKG